MSHGYDFLNESQRHVLASGTRISESYLHSSIAENENCRHKLPVNHEKYAEGTCRSIASRLVYELHGK